MLRTYILQSMERMVSRYWCVPGRNSRNKAESTGRLPPTPTLQRAAKLPMAAKLGLLAAIMPKTAVMPIVKLKAHRRPKTSHPKPQNTAPKRRPMFCASVRNYYLISIPRLVSVANTYGRSCGVKLISDGRQDQRGDNRP
jgi:hypothetical protein